MKLAVATCFYNFAGYKQPARNLRRFIRSMRSQGAPVYGVELILDGDMPVTTGQHGWSQLVVSPAAVMWQKEKLINAAVASVPDAYDAIAWIDCDIQMLRPNWKALAESALKSHAFVQLYDNALWTGEDGSLIAQRTACIKQPDYSKSHAGFAWAAKRAFFEQIGLYDLCVSGAGDIAFASAACNRVMPPQKLDSLPGGDSYEEWKARVVEYVKQHGRPSSIKNTVVHEWHGDLKNRDHQSRHFGMNTVIPEEHLIDRGPFYEWSESAPPAARRSVNRVFQRRLEDGQASRPRVTYEPIKKVTVIASTHDAYAHMFGDVAKSIEAQTIKPEQFIAAVDGVSIDLPLDENWGFTGGRFGSPNPGRNLALSMARNEWVVFWDGDNTMPPNYLESLLHSTMLADSKTAFVYPSIQYIEPNGVAGKKLTMPEYDYWLLRQRPLADTSSLWRRDAVLGVGGFSHQQPRLDDYELSLRLTAAGWNGLRSNAFTHIHRHAARRSKTGNLTEAMWQAHTFGLLTLWSGYSPEATDKLIDWYCKAELPPHTRIYWVAGDKALRQRLSAVAASLNLESVSIIDAGQPWVANGRGTRDFSRHLHVANLYNKIVPRIDEDYLMMIEDDNIGPLNGVRSLLSSFEHFSRTSCVAGLYRSRSNPGSACASIEPTHWKTIQYDAAADKLVMVYMVGGGFTLHGNWGIKKALPFRCTLKDGRVSGWDAHLGSALTSNGYEMLMRGDIKVDHLCPEVMEFLSKKSHDRAGLLIDRN